MNMLEYHSVEGSTHCMLESTGQRQLAGCDWQGNVSWQLWNLIQNYASALWVGNRNRGAGATRGNDAKMFSTS